MKHGTLGRVDEVIHRPGEPVRYYDEWCGSGRRLVALKREANVEGFYRVDFCPSCAKMSIINLFMNKVPKVEILCLDVPVDGVSKVHSCYRFTSSNSLIEQVFQPEESLVWRLWQSADFWSEFRKCD